MTLHQTDRLKAQLDALRPLDETALRRLNEAMRVEYTFDSNRIEGNTLSLQETALVVEQGLTIGGHTVREHLEAINHAEAVDFIRDVAAGDEDISEHTIKDIHSIVLRGIDRENAGQYRTVGVMISGSTHLPPAPYLLAGEMEAFMASFQKMEAHPVLAAAWLHDELVRIHPFVDGNGRTARLLMNLYLLRHGYPIVSLKGDPESRMKYYKALERSHTTGDRSDFEALVTDAVGAAVERYLAIVG